MQLVSSAFSRESEEMPDVQKYRYSSLQSWALWPRTMIGLNNEILKGRGTAHLEIWSAKKEEKMTRVSNLVQIGFDNFSISTKSHLSWFDMAIREEAYGASIKDNSKVMGSRDREIFQCSLVHSGRWQEEVRGVVSVHITPPLQITSNDGRILSVATVISRRCSDLFLN